VRASLTAAQRPGESEAAAVRRLLTVALHPSTHAALMFLEAHHEDQAAAPCLECDPECDPLTACPVHERYLSAAATLAELADATATPEHHARHEALIAGLAARLCPATEPDEPAGPQLLHRLTPGQARLFLTGGTRADS
jgi:hypothetical protein